MKRLFSLLVVGVFGLIALYYLLHAFYAFAIWIAYFLAIGLIYEIFRLIAKTV